MTNIFKLFLLGFILIGLTSYIVPDGSGDTPFENEVGTRSVRKSSFLMVPVFSNCPSDITNVMPNSGDCTAVVNWTPPTATGSGPVTISSNYNPGDLFYAGTHRVIYRATDSNGTSFCEFIVQVVDNQPPVITVPANITTTADAGSCGAVVTFPFPTATDNCPAGEGAPIDENFDTSKDLTTECYDFNGTFVGSSGEVNGTVGELETAELINNDTRSFTSPLTQFNGTGEIFFDHKIITGSILGFTGNNPMLTVKLISTGGTEIIIFNETYVNENVQTEYIPIPQVGSYFVQFEWDTNVNRNDIAYLDDLYIPGFVVSDNNLVSCARARHVVRQFAGQPFRSGVEFPVGTTTLEYVSRDAAGNPSFESFTVTVTNNIVPPAGNNVEYCEGTPVPTLSVTVGPGETVDWYDTAVGGTLLLAGSTTYTPPGQGFYYAETRNITTGCVSGGRRRIRVLENPQPNPPIAASPIEYCVNNTATPLTATGDPGNSINWYDAPTGGTLFPSAPTPDTSSAGTTSYYVDQEDSSTGCLSERTQVDVIVYSLPIAPTVTTPIEYCVGDSSAQLNSHASGTDLRWYDAATGGTEIPGTTQPDTSTAGQQFFWVTQSSPSGGTNCESTRAMLTVNINNPPVITTQPTDQEMCEGGNATFTGDASDATSFQWQFFNGASWDNITDDAVYSGSTTNTLSITGNPPRNRYRLAAQSPGGSCPDTFSNPANLTVNPAPAAPMSGGDQTECAQNPVQTLTASATPPSGATIVWYNAPTGGSVIASPILDTVGTITYYAESENTTTNCLSSARTAVTLTIQAAPATPTSGGDQTECEQDPIQTLTSTATAPSGASVVWYTAATGGSIVSEPILNSTGTVTYYAQSNDNVSGCPSNLRTAVSLTIQAAPTPPSSGGDQVECEVTPTQTLTATATVPSGSTLVWYDAANGGNIVPSPTLNTVGTITYYAASENTTTSCPSTTRTPVTLTIEEIPIAPTSGGDQTECEANPTQTLTAAATAPSGATVEWFDAPSGGNTVASPTLSAVGTVTYYAQSNTASSGCVSNNRTPVTLTINSRPTIAITPASQSCSADLTTYEVSVDVNRGTVSATEGTVTDNGGNNWTIAGITSGNNITVTVTDSNTCSESISINAPNCACPTVNAPTSGGDQTECEENPLQTLTATAIPPSGASIVWYDAATGGNTVASPTLNAVGTTTYYAESVDNVNNCASSTKTPVTLTIQAAPTAPISGGDQTECETAPTQTLTATANGPAGTNVIWYDAISGGNIVASPTLNTVGTITYFAESQDNGTSCPSHSRTAVTLTIEPNPAAPTSGGDQTECETNPIQTLTATATAPAGSSVVWYDAASGGNIVANPTLNTVGTITYFAESSNNSSSCASFTRTPVSLTIQDTPDITISSAPTCAPDLLTYAVSVDVSEGTVTSTEGTVVDNGGNNWTISGITSGNDITLTVTAPNSCIQTLAVTAPDCNCPVVDAPVSGGDQTECEENPIQTLTATATPPADATIVWYDAASGGNVIASPTLNTVGTITYFAESVQNVTNCTSNTRTAVILTIQETPAAPTSGGDQTECETNPIQTLTATATAPAGSSVVWYDAASGGNIVASPTLNTVGTITYFAESNDDATACSSFNKTAVQLTIHPLPPVVANATETMINAGEPVTLTGSGANSYVWDNGVTDGDTVFPLVTTTYTVIGTDGNTCENADSITIVVGATSDIRLEKTVDVATPNVGDTVVFTLTATNDGPSDDTGGSVVNDALPIGYTYTSDTGSAVNGTYDNATGNWTLPALANGNNVSVNLSATVNAPTGAANEYNNIAQVTIANNFDPNSTPNNDDGDQSEDDEAAISTTPQVSDLSVTNSISQPTANPGDILTITVDVQNNGPSDATTITIENIVPNGFTVTTINNAGTQTGNTISWIGLNIPSGTSTSLNFEVTVNNPTGTTDEYLNTVQVTAVDQFDSDSTPNNDDGDQSEDDEDNILFILQSTDLEVVNTVSPDSGNPGDPLTFTVAVTNTGIDDATNVALENIVPSGFTVININNGGTQTGNVISWNGLSIPNGTTTTLTFEVTINVPTNTAGEYVNAVQVVAVDQLDPDSAPNNDDGDQSEDDEDNAEIVLIPADLSLNKSLSAASNPTPNAGDTVTFEITITNNGPGIATNVTVEDTLPIGYTLGVVNDGGTVTGNMISWSIATIPVGTQVLSYEVTLNAPTNEEDEYTNIAQVTTSDQFDPNSTPNNDDGDQSEDDEINHMIEPPTVDLEINKTVDKPQTFFEDTIVFTITATNNSTYEATNIGIEDVLPSGYILVSTTADAGDYNETTTTWEIPSIAIGATASLEMTVTVTDIEDYTNIAELIYVDQIDLNLDNDRAEVTPDITQSECLTIYNSFSPNGDGTNEVFYIECIEQYPNNYLQIFNRWGTKVFDMKGYDNTWRGDSTGRATMGVERKLPVGTYYYTLDSGDGSTKLKAGWLYISS